MCLRCLDNAGKRTAGKRTMRCMPPGEKAVHKRQAKPEAYLWGTACLINSISLASYGTTDAANLTALAAFHNAVVERGRQPGNWMGDGQPEFYIIPFELAGTSATGMGKSSTHRTQ